MHIAWVFHSLVQSEKFHTFRTGPLLGGRMELNLSLPRDGRVKYMNHNLLTLTVARMRIRTDPVTAGTRHSSTEYMVWNGSYWLHQMLCIGIVLLSTYPTPEFLAYYKHSYFIFSIANLREKHYVFFYSEKIYICSWLLRSEIY